MGVSTSLMTKSHCCAWHCISSPSGVAPGSQLSPCNAAVMEPFGVTDVVHVGLAEEKFLLRPLLEQWGAKHGSNYPKGYKTVLNAVRYRGHTKAHREHSYSWLSSCMQQIVDDVAEARGVPRHEVGSADLPDVKECNTGSKSCTQIAQIDLYPYGSYVPAACKSLFSMFFYAMSLSWQVCMHRSSSI